MKRKKLLISLLVVSGILGMTSCSLFDDSDLAFSNEFNPPIEEPSIDPDAIYCHGAIGKTIEEVPNALCFKNINYSTEDGKIINTYKTGGVNQNEYNPNSGEDYVGTKSRNNYDMYVPNSAPKDAKHTVLLFIHGGAWVSGFKTDVNQYVYDFANRGYITATPKYTLLRRTMDDPTLSIFRDLDEIDACVTSIKTGLEELGFDTTKTELVIGGASSGSHLAMLYSYSRGNNAALPIKFIVNAVGPVDIKPDNWKSFKVTSDAVLDAGLGYTAIETQRTAGNLNNLPIAGQKGEEGEDTTWNDYQTMRIANGMCGLPYPLEQIEATADEHKKEIAIPNDASISMTKVGGGEDLLSVTYWMTASNKIPMIAAYSGKDTIVGIAQYAKLQQEMDALGLTYQHYYFRDCGHNDINKDETVYNNFINKIDDWCKAPVI